MSRSDNKTKLRKTSPLVPFSLRPAASLNPQNVMAHQRPKLGGSKLNSADIEFVKSEWEAEGFDDQSKISILHKAIGGKAKKFIQGFFSYCFEADSQKKLDAKDLFFKVVAGQQGRISQDASREDIEQKSKVFTADDFILNSYFLIDQILQIPQDKEDGDVAKSFLDNIWNACNFVYKNNSGQEVNFIKKFWRDILKEAFNENNEETPSSKARAEKRIKQVRNILLLFKAAPVLEPHPLLWTESKHLAKILPYYDVEPYKENQGHDIRVELLRSSLRDKNSEILIGLLLFYKNKPANNKEYIDEFVSLAQDHHGGDRESVLKNIFTIVAASKSAPFSVVKDLWDAIESRKQQWFDIVFEAEESDKITSQNAVKICNILSIYGFTNDVEESPISWANPQTSRSISHFTVLASAAQVSAKRFVGVSYWNSLTAERQREIWSEAIEKKRFDIIGFIFGIPKEDRSSLNDEDGKILKMRAAIEILNKKGKLSHFKDYLLRDFDQVMRQKMWFDAIASGNAILAIAINFCCAGALIIQQGENVILNPVEWRAEDGKSSILKAFEAQTIRASLVENLIKSGARVDSWSDVAKMERGLEDFQLRVMREKGADEFRKKTSVFLKLKQSILTLKNSYAQKVCESVDFIVENSLASPSSYEIENEAVQSALLNKISNLPDVEQSSCQKEFLALYNKVIKNCTRHGEFKIGTIAELWSGFRKSGDGRSFSENHCLSDKEKTILAYVFCQDAALTVSPQALAQNPELALRNIVDAFRGDNFDQLKDFCAKMGEKTLPQSPPSDAAKTASAANLQQQQSQQGQGSASQ